jgi:hypothetical protein
MVVGIKCGLTGKSPNPFFAPLIMKFFIFPGNIDRGCKNDGI